MVDAMIACCAEKTYAATTIADIVAAAHVSRTTFYREFADRRSLFEAAVERCLGELREAAGDRLDADEEPPRALREAAAAALELLAERPELAHVLVGDAVAVEPAVVERYRGFLLPAIAALWRRHGVEGAHHLDPVLAFGRAQLLVFGRIASGRPERLPELLPEIVYLGVAPYAGHEAALAEARASELTAHRGVGR